MTWPDAANTVPASDVQAGDTLRTLVLIDDIPVKCLLREDPSEPLLVTTHPVEYGEDIADYVLELPKTLTLDCKFLDDDFGTPGVTLEGVEDAAGGTPATWQERKNAIEEKKAKHQLITINTGYRVYPNYLLTEIILDRRPQTALSWTVQLVFQHIATVDSEWVSVPLEAIPVEKRSDKLTKGARRGQGKKNGGEAPASELSAEEKQRVEDALNGLAGI